MQSLRNAIAPAERESPTRQDQLFAENMRFLFSSWIRWAGSATRARRTDSGALHAVSHGEEERLSWSHPLLALLRPALLAR